MSRRVTPPTVACHVSHCADSDSESESPSPTASLSSSDASRPSGTAYRPLATRDRRSTAAPQTPSNLVGAAHPRQPKTLTLISPPPPPFNPPLDEAAGAATAPFNPPLDEAAAPLPPPHAARTAPDLRHHLSLPPPLGRPTVEAGQAGASRVAWPRPRSTGRRVGFRMRKCSRKVSFLLLGFQWVVEALQRSSLSCIYNASR
jgi:hypothetical protein